MSRLQTIAATLCLCTVGVETSVAAEVQQTSAGTFACVESQAAAQPPQGPAASLPQAGLGLQGVGGPKLSPVCREGLVPVAIRPNTKFFPKGNPLFRSYRVPAGPVPQEFVNQSLLRPFDEVYGKGTPTADSLLSPLAAAVGCNGVDSFGSCFYYVSAGASFTGSGAGMTLQIEAPVVSGANAAGHSIGEIAVEGSASALTDVEMGYIVSPNQFGDNKTHLFTFYWTNGTGHCYDAGCGWVQVSSTYFPGMNINSLVGHNVPIAWVQFQGNWWAMFNGEYIGYYPNSLWSGTFTTATSAQWYGEVATPLGAANTTQMGNGQFGTQSTAASMTALCAISTGSTACNPVSEQGVNVDTVPSYYNFVNFTDGFRYGGPGSH